MQLTIDSFTDTIKESRCKESSWDPEARSRDNPSYRQCDVTALLAHALLWLDIYTEKVTLASTYTNYHYFNKDKENKPIRFCEEQFIHDNILVREDEKKLKHDRIDIFLRLYPSVYQRYEILRQRFQGAIKNTIS